jgi:hypothetical protein
MATIKGHTDYPELHHVYLVDVKSSASAMDEHEALAMEYLGSKPLKPIVR